MFTTAAAKQIELHAPIILNFAYKNRPIHNKWDQLDWHRQARPSIGDSEELKSMVERVLKRFEEEV